MYLITILLSPTILELMELSIAMLTDPHFIAARELLPYQKLVRTGAIW
jgi:hypothetical protein